MDKIGEKLRNARELRKLTIKEISKETNISSKYLEALEAEEFDKMLKDNKIKCTCGGKLSKTIMFNLMVKTFLGPKQDEIAYFRPEACQTIFTDFSLVFRASRAKLPVGIAQVGKAFRNEISPRNAIIRTREFTQAEVEVFFNPEKEDE